MRLIFTCFLCLSCAVIFSLAEEESLLAKIRKKGVLVVGTTGDYKPFSYSQDGESYQGFDIMIADSFAQHLGVELVFTQTSWKGLIPGLLASKFDLGMSGITRTESRLKVACFSNPYLLIGKSPLVRLEDKGKYSSLEYIDQKGVKVGVNLGGTNEKYVRKVLKNATIIPYEDNLQVPKMVAEGVVDVMITDNIEALHYAKNSERLYAESPGKPFTSSCLAYITKKDDMSLVSELNVWMLSIEEEAWYKELRKKYLE